MFAKRSDGTKLMLLHVLSGRFEWFRYEDRIEVGPEYPGSPVVDVLYAGMRRTGVSGRDWQEAIRQAQAEWNLW